MMVTIKQLRDQLLGYKGLSTNYAARKLAERNGLNWFRLNGSVFIEAEEAIAEVYWMNRKHTMMGVREATCPE